MANLKGKIGAGIGGLAGGVGGFMVGGPYGALAGAGAGASVGEKVGGGTSDFYDNVIGREGIIGAIGSATGLWESGSEADARRKAKDANTKYLASLEEKKQQVMPNAMNLMNTENLANAGEFEGLLGGLGSGGLATNNNKTIERNKMVASSLARMNAKFDRTVEGANNKMDTIDDSIYLAEQQRRDLT